MRILKTTARLFTHDMDESLDFLSKLVGRQPDYRFMMKKQGWEIAGIEDFVVVAGNEDALKPIRFTHGPVVVDDLASCKRLLIAAKAEIIVPEAESETGRFLYARHPDGNEVEHVEWKPELRERIFGNRGL